ncbi:MAG: hypothetical protein U5K79_11630 [Cyclobacteriaceae bacterium]|nr:hypothetical protein [Cyclobacteriaceae bacterium]
MQIEAFSFSMDFRQILKANPVFELIGKMPMKIETYVVGGLRPDVS